MAACLHGSAAGCDTPVYRYAMYRWHPAPYELYYFYEGQPDAEGEKVKAAVEALTGTMKPAANLAFLPVDVQKDKELTGVPPDVKDAWGKRSPQQTPWYLMSSPVGMHMLGGTIAEREVAALIDSPVRQEIGKLLEQGQAGVYLLLTCDDCGGQRSGGERNSRRGGRSGGGKNRPVCRTADSPRRMTPPNLPRPNSGS